MLLKILTYTGKLMLESDASLFQDGWIANTTELEKLRTVDSTSRDDDFLSSLDGILFSLMLILATNSLLAVEKDLLGMSSTEYLEVGQILVGSEMSTGRIGSSSFFSEASRTEPDSRVGT